MKNKINFIFDTETNGFANCSVLSISYIICKNDNILHKDTRYYFAKEPYNYHACKVHGLDEDTIKDKRDNCSYPLYFMDDKNWLIDILNKYNVNNIVAHNLSFDVKFLPQEIKNKIKKNIFWCLKKICQPIMQMSVVKEDTKEKVLKYISTLNSNLEIKKVIKCILMSSKTEN